MKGTHLKIPDGTNTQRFYKQWDLIDSSPDSNNVPRGVNPYAPNDSFAKHRTEAVKSLLPSCFTKRSGWKQKIDKFHDRGDRRGQQFWGFRVMQEHKSSFQGLTQGIISSARIKYQTEAIQRRLIHRLLFVVIVRVVQF